MGFASVLGFVFDQLSGERILSSRARPGSVERLPDRFFAQMVNTHLGMTQNRPPAGSATRTAFRSRREIC
jgi:hypothetical protein